MKNSNFLAIIIIATGALLGSKLNLSIAWGAHMLSFSLFALLIPLLGQYLSIGKATTITTCLYALKALFYGTPITLGIPTLAATASWSTHQAEKKRNAFFNALLHVILPLSCMILFYLHPVGRNAFSYSLYWLIPIGIYLLEQKRQHRIAFFKALQSTFVAHAVGSVIWLYRIPMTAEQWLALIPFVAIERITFACATTVLFMATEKIVSWASSRQRFFKPFKLYS